MQPQNVIRWKIIQTKSDYVIRHSFISDFLIQIIEKMLLKERYGSIEKGRRAEAKMGWGQEAPFRTPSIPQANISSMGPITMGKYFHRH